MTINANHRRTAGWGPIAVFGFLTLLLLSGVALGVHYVW